MYDKRVREVKREKKRREEQQVTREVYINALTDERNKKLLERYSPENKRERESKTDFQTKADGLEFKVDDRTLRGKKEREEPAVTGKPVFKDSKVSSRTRVQTA